MDIRYIPSITNSAADALSRYPYVQPPEMNPATPEELVEVCLIVRGLVVDGGIRMDGLIQRRELPWGDEQGRWLKNGVDC